MIDPNSFAVEKTIWACADTPGGSGNGSKTSPFRTGGNLGALSLGPSVRLHLLPGNYTTSGIICGKVFILDGAGGVTITLEPNIHPSPVVRMFTDWTNWCSFFSVRGVILDGNYQNNPGSQSGNFKIEPISVQTIIGEVNAVTVRNFGAAARGYGLLGLECFPLSLTTFCSGDKHLYDVRYKDILELYPSRLEITDCVVEKPHFTDGGYCTGIFVKTSLGSYKGDRQQFGTRSSQAALVRGNTVNVPGGICYGAANVEQTVFEYNRGTGKCAFNLDTGVADLLTIRNNIFADVAQGLQLSPDSGGSRVTVDSNSISLGTPFYNPVTKNTEDQWGIRAARLGMSSANNNVFTVPASLMGHVIDGIAGVGNVVHQQENLVVKELSPSHEATIARLATVEAELVKTQSSLADVLLSSATKIAELQKSLTESSELLNRTCADLNNANKRIEKFIASLTHVRNVFDSL